jgi:hypothetical protein
MFFIKRDQLSCSPIFINLLTPELNPSAQRCLTRFFTGNVASWTVHFSNICVKNQQMQQLFIQFIDYVHVSALHCHLQGSVYSAFWEMRNWGAVDRTLWLGVLCLVTWCVAIWDTTHQVTTHNTPIHHILSTAPQLRISQKALGTLPEDGNILPKHVGSTIHN